VINMGTAKAISAATMTSAPASSSRFSARRRAADVLRLRASARQSACCVRSWRVTGAKKPLRRDHRAANGREAEPGVQARVRFDAAVFLRLIGRPAVQFAYHATSHERICSISRSWARMMSLASLRVLPWTRRSRIALARSSACV
jgi:hypothetical protein